MSMIIMLEIMVRDPDEDIFTIQNKEILLNDDNDIANYMIIIVNLHCKFNNVK